MADWLDATEGADGQWYLYNDDLVRSASKEEVLKDTQGTYVFFGWTTWICIIDVCSRLQEPGSLLHIPSCHN